MEIKNLVLNNSIKIEKEIISDIKGLFTILNYEPIWQTIDWNLMLQKAGYINKGFFIGIYENDFSLSNFGIIEKRSIGLGQYAFFILGGPINDRYTDIFENEIIKLAKSQNIIYIQIEPLIEMNFKYFKQINLKKFIETHTVTLDLTKTEEEILSEMKPKGRYNIKVAEKNEISIEKAANSKENLDIFYNLLKETNTRDSFNINSIDYFNILLGYIYECNIGGLYFAKKDNEVIASGIFLMLENTCYYYYGASTSDNSKRKYMASYLIQWRLIQEAKLKGIKIYDFL